MRDRLVRLLSRELAATRDGLAEIHSLPLEERVEKGDCIDQLRFLGWDDEGRGLVLSCPDNVSRFRAGEKLSLGAGEDPAQGVSVVYRSFDPAARLLRVEKDRWETGGWNEIDLGGTLALDRKGSDFSRVALDAVEAVYSSDDERSRRIRGILERTARQTVEEGERAAALTAVERLALDPSQREAFVAASATRPFQLVQGPPGSGKTWLIALLASEWAAKGERILVTAYTHRAVNNVLRAVAKVDRVPAMIKVGEDHNADDLPTKVRRARSAKHVPPASRGAGQVVGVTLFALKHLWGEAAFDRVIFDEAAQIPIPHAICGMLAGRRYVFVGDHRQLGPIVVADHEDETAGLSIFAHLAGESPAAALRQYEPTLLRRTYRMNAGINVFPNARFYGGELSAEGESAARRFVFRPGGPLDDLFDPECPAIIASIAHEGHRTRCLPEARLVADLLTDFLVRQGRPLDEIAVVTPFRAQIRAIRNLLHERLGTRATRAELPVIDTVERIQGQEREAVIVSLACSEPEYAAREAAFFFSPNRLNVTLTRARTKLIIAMSPRLIEALPSALEDLAHSSLFARLYRELPKVDLSDRYLTPIN